MFTSLEPADKNEISISVDKEVDRVCRKDLPWYRCCDVDFYLIFKEFCVLFCRSTFNPRGCSVPRMARHPKTSDHRHSPPPTRMKRIASKLYRLAQVRRQFCRDLQEWPNTPWTYKLSIKSPNSLEPTSSAK
jgi:hypothetical protein